MSILLLPAYEFTYILIGGIYIRPLISATTRSIKDVAYISLLHNIVFYLDLNMVAYVSICLHIAVPYSKIQSILATTDGKHLSPTTDLDFNIC